MSERRTSAEIRNELEHAKFRHRTLLVEIGIAEKKLEELKQEANALEDRSSWSLGAGLLRKLSAELAAAERYEAHDNCPEVVWRAKPYYAGSTVYVVDKVTAKTIFVTHKGGTHKTAYELDGTSRSSGSWVDSIDIRQTFGIDSDSVPPNWKPTAAVVTA